MTPDDDPGWPRGLSILLFMIPGAVQWYMRRHATDDGLLVLRRVFLSFTAALVWLGIVLVSLKPVGDAIVPWFPILVGVVIVTTVAERVIERPLDCSTDGSLAARYRSRFFLRIAFANIVALWAFLFVFIGAAKWIYYAGAAFTLIRFATGVAPTRTALARDQEVLNASGCTRSLVAALRTVPPEPKGRRRRSTG